MFMTMIWILAIASSTFEMAFAFKVPLWAKMAGRYPVLGLIASVTLSWFLGHIFGAAGLIALMGGLLSTLMTVPCYILVEKWHNGEIQPRLEKFRSDWESFVVMMKDLWRVIRFVIRVVTFPVWGYRSAREWILTQKMRFARG